MTETRPLEPEEWEFWDTWMRAQRLLARELERGLQRDCGISKAEYSVLVTLWGVRGREMRVSELSESLGWDKSRVSHQLTRMEHRGLVRRTPYAADGRRAGITLTPQGLSTAHNATLVHGTNIRRHVLGSLTPEQATVIRTWSNQTLQRLTPHHDTATNDGGAATGGSAATSDGGTSNGGGASNGGAAAGDGVS